MEVAGLTLGAVGLLVAVKGAIDGYTLIEQLIQRDSGVQDRAIQLQCMKEKLDQWSKDYHVQESTLGPIQLRGDCLLQFQSVADRNKTTEILGLIRKHLNDAEALIQAHVRVPKPKGPGFMGKFTSKHESKGWTAWVAKDKEKLDGILILLKDRLGNLLQSTEHISELQRDKWESKIRKFTTIDETQKRGVARGLRQQGTCQWILQRPEYKDWMSSTDTNLLWINGPPGTGKTVLSCAVIDELERDASPSEGKICLSYFYCDYNDRARQNLAGLFGCIAAQLSRQNLAIRHAIREYLATFRSAHEEIKAHSVDYQALAQVIIDSQKNFDCVYVVIDAADEFLPPSNSVERNQPSDRDWRERKALLETLMKLQVAGNGKIKVLITSRPTAEIQDAMRNVRRTTISGDSNSKDIETYVTAELEKEMSKGTRWGDTLTDGEQQTPTVKSGIVSSLVEKASGMFLFAVLQLKILLSRNPKKDVSVSLALLPPDIAGVWERLLLDLDAANTLEEDRETIKKILKWLVATSRPLTLEEISAAVAVQELKANTELGDNAEDDQWLLELCGPLVRLTSNGGSDQQELSLIHFSLKEFLTSGELLRRPVHAVHGYNIDLRDANSYLAKISLTYLTSKSLEKSYSNHSDLGMLRKQYTLLDYAIIYGSTHLRPLDYAEEKLIQLLNDLFIQRVGPGQAQAVHNGRLYLKLFRQLSDWRRKDHPDSITPLYYASKFGWKAGVEKLLVSNGRQAIGDELNHALRVAAVGDFIDVIETLVKAGADVKAHLGYDLGSPFQSAAYCGNEKAMRKLIELGAEMDEDEPYHRTGGTVGSAFQGAVLSDDERLVQFLIDEGVDMNSNKGWLGTALQAALEAGKHKMALFLIKQPKFNPKVTGGYYGSASRYCCFEGAGLTDEILRAILDKDGFPSERVGPYGSLLEIAAHFGHLTKVKLLLEKIVKVDNKSLGTFGNAIHAAAMQGNEQIVDLLLRHGADPNCPGHWLGRWDDNAVESPDDDVPLVLRQGEGFLAFGHSGITHAFFAPMLHSALRLRDDDHNKIHMFFESEPTHREGHLGNPLQAASFIGHAEIIRRLVCAGARINATGGFFGTALQAAASQGHVKAVQELLDLGADPNVTDVGHYGTALAAAIAIKCDEIVQSLIDSGADAGILDGHGWSAKIWCTLGDWKPKAQYPDFQEQCHRTSAWSLTNRSNQLQIDEIGCGVVFPGRVLVPDVYGFRAMYAASVIADHPISACEDFYFEVEIREEGQPGWIAVGLSEKDVPTFKLPGMAAPSWGYRGDERGCFAELPQKGLVWPHGASYGYHGDDGHCFAENQERPIRWPQFGTGDVVGCGITWTAEKLGKGAIFWTLNGQRLEPSVDVESRRLYPALGLMSEGASTLANFGKDAFRYEAAPDSGSELEVVTKPVQFSS